jgi:hypothetical protein
MPPSTVIEDDATGSVETSGIFDPATDGIDFYESLEGMRVQVNQAVAVGPRNSFGEIPVVGDRSAHAGVDSVRGGLLIRPDDFNPERIILDDTLVATPVVNVRDSFTTPVVGVMDYSFATSSSTSPPRWPGSTAACSARPPALPGTRSWWLGPTTSRTWTQVTAGPSPATPG